jgi:hypothetical protein
VAGAEEISLYHTCYNDSGYKPNLRDGKRTVVLYTFACLLWLRVVCVDCCLLGVCVPPMKYTQAHIVECSFFCCFLSHLCTFLAGEIVNERNVRTICRFVIASLIILQQIGAQ